MSEENAGGGSSPDGTKLRRDSPPSLTGDKSSEEDARSSTSSPLLDTAPLPTSSDPMCPYCAKPFRKPRVLDCLHSMCEDCIIAQIGDGDASRNANLNSATDCMLENSCHLRPTPPGVIRCPVCYQESHVGNDERFVSQMLLDYVRLHNSDGAKDKVRSCRACKSEQPAVAVCKECSSDLCKNCVQAHRDMKLFDGHHVYTYDELAAKCLELPREPVTCARHALVPCTILCATCEVLMCQYCQPEHADHNLVTVDEVVGKIVKEELAKYANSALAKAKEGEDACNSIPEQQQNLADQYDGTVAIIEDLFSDITRAVDEVKSRVMRDLENARDNGEADLENYSRKFHATIAKISDAVEFTNRLVEEGTELEVLASRKKILQQLTSLVHSMPDMNSTIQLSFERPKYSDITNDLYKIVGRVSYHYALNSVKSEASLSSLRDRESSAFKQLSALASNVSEQSSSIRGIPSESSLSRFSNPGVIGSKANTVAIKPATSSAFSAYTGGPGTIGMERRQKSGTISSNNSNADFTNGWPPSSLPPEPPTPSPPSDFTANQSAVNSGASSVYNWPPSSNPPLAAEPSPTLRPNVSQAPGSALSSNLLAQQLATTMSSILGVQSSSSVWTAPQPAAVGAQLSGNGFGPSLRQRQSYPSLFDTMADSGPFRMPLPGAGMFEPMVPNLGRQSQCVTPSEQISLPQSILHDRQFMSLGIMPAWRSGAPKNNAAATDLNLRWQIGGLGAAPGQFNSPHGFCLGMDDEILVADTNNHRVQVISKAGKVLLCFGTGGSEDGNLFYPKKVIPYRPYFMQGYIVVDKGETKARLQLFSRSGEFVRRIVAPFIDYVAALTMNESGKLVIFSSASMMFVLDIEQDPALVLKWSDCSKSLSEPSDVALYERLYYVTDYKQHRVVVFNIEGETIRVFGSMETTPYPIGIDISKAGDVLVADSHGNHFHILALSNLGQKVQDFECTQIKVSRCVGVRITSEGLVVSISKHNHNVLLFDTLYLTH